MLSPDQKSNFRHLYFDVAWFGVLAGSAMAFLAVYAARLGATSWQVGLLNAGPALMNLAFSLPAGRWLEGRRIVETSFWTAIVHRSGYAVMICLPWLLAGGQQVWGMVLITLGMSIPGTILAIAFNAMYAEVVTPGWRAQVIGRRNAILAISVTLTTLLSGRILDKVLFPINYQIVFGIGAVGGLMSGYHLMKLRTTTEPSVQFGPLVRRMFADLQRAIRGIFRAGRGLLRSQRGSRQAVVRLDLLRGPFGAFLLAYLAFYTFQYLPFPLVPLYFVNQLHLTDGMISLGSALFYGMMMVVSLGINRISSRYGHRKMLVVSSMLFGFYPLMIALAKDATLYYVASIFGGGIYAILAGGLVNRLMERVPEDDRPAHMALHNLALNLGILAGSLLGPLTGNQYGLVGAMFLSAGLRTLAGILLWLLA